MRTLGFILLIMLLGGSHLMVAALRLQRGIMRPNIRKVDGRHRFCFGAVQSRLYSTADMGKRAAREKAKNEVRLRNIRYREASSAARGGERDKG